MTTENRPPFEAGTVVVLEDGTPATVIKRQDGPKVYVGWLTEVKRFQRRLVVAAPLLVLFEARRSVRW